MGERLQWGHPQTEEPLEGLKRISSFFRSFPGQFPFRGLFTQRPPLEGILKPPALRVVDDLPFADWGKVFDSTTVATAIADRLVYNSDVLILGGESYRRKLT